ncbi:MAG: hypothetical protein IT348_20055 [Candidatus Eisenbacteria bacterium]|nr:hypothetical protein [Candidatus Eisenbacteria bacterium]
MTHDHDTYQPLDGPSGLSFRRPSTLPRSTRANEPGQLAADVAAGCAAEPQVEQAEPPEVKASQTGSKTIRLCARCGARLSPRSRAHRTYCGNTCRGRAAKARQATPALFEREEGRR